MALKIQYPSATDKAGIDQFIKKINCPKLNTLPGREFYLQWNSMKTADGLIKLVLQLCEH